MYLYSKLTMLFVTYTGLIVNIQGKTNFVGPKTVRNSNLNQLSLDKIFNIKVSMMIKYLKYRSHSEQVPNVFKAKKNWNFINEISVTYLSIKIAVGTTQLLPFILHVNDCYSVKVHCSCFK